MFLFFPFHQRLKKLEKNESTYETLELLKQVKVNIPLLDMIKEVPRISKFLKDLCTRKRNLNVHKEPYMAAVATSYIQSGIPPKYKDPGCPTISCQIGNFTIEKSLLDLGGSVNILPYSDYLQFDLGEIQDTRVIL